MAIARWEPLGRLWNEMHRFHQEVDRAFDRWGFGETQPRLPLAASYPPINVWEDADYLRAEVELPGLKLDDLEIYVTGGNQLLLKGTRQACVPDKGIWHRQERAFGTFERVVTLPMSVDADKVEARFENGVLTISMPKSADAKPRKISIKSE